MLRGQAIALKDQAGENERRGKGELTSRIELINVNNALDLNGSISTCSDSGRCNLLRKVTSVFRISSKATLAPHDAERQL
jgi:hypothetical protein